MNTDLLWIEELASTLSGIVVGALLAWLITHVYARKAVRDMARQRDQAQWYNRVLTALFRRWEEQGLVELSRDSKGELTDGRVIRSHSTAPAAPDGAAGTRPGGGG